MHHLIIEILSSCTWVHCVIFKSGFLSVEQIESRWYQNVQAALFNEIEWGLTLKKLLTKIMQLMSYISNQKYKCYLRTVGEHKDTLGIWWFVHTSWTTVVLWCAFVIFWSLTFVCRLLLSLHVNEQQDYSAWDLFAWSTEDRKITSRWQIFHLWVNYLFRAWRAPDDCIRVLGVCLFFFFFLLLHTRPNWTDQL